MLQALVEAALQGQDQRLVARCDVGGIVTAFEGFGVYDPDMLRSTLHASMPALQLALGGTAPPSFLPLLKTKLGEQQSPAPPEAAAGACLPNVQLPTPSPAPPAMAAQLPLVVTVRFNGKLLAERTTLNVEPIATFEQVARSPSRPRSRGRAPRASRRASSRCSGRCSSPRPSARPVQRRSGRGARDRVQCARQAEFSWPQAHAALRP